jgi:hypothetical protein
MHEMMTDQHYRTRSLKDFRMCAVLCPSFSSSIMINDDITHWQLMTALRVVTHRQ